MKGTILLLLLLPLILSTSKNKVTDLFKSVNIEYTGTIYSGYLSTGVAGQEHFYVFTESIKPSDKLLVYIHGGPGCSALSTLIAENGPVVTDAFSGVFHLNKYSWNQNMHVLYIDSPAGVGFSKTNSPETVFEDQMTAKAHWASLFDFIKLFSEYKFKELYIAGPGYSGVYLPYLVQEIYNQEDIGVPLMGILIGNGLTDKTVEVEKSFIDFGYLHGIISLELKKEYYLSCPILDEVVNDAWPRDVTKQCNLVRQRIKDSWEGIDLFGIYHQCRPPVSNEFSIQQAISQTRNKFNAQYGLEPEISIWPSPCSFDPSVSSFLNSEVVKDKLKVDTTIKWVDCSNKILTTYKMTDSIDLYMKVLFTKKVKVWFYSGDGDACVSTIGSMRWIQKTEWKMVGDYTQWKCQNQVAGFYQAYENNFTFVTVKGGSHLSSLDKRPEMKTLLDAFIAGKF